MASLKLAVRRALGRCPKDITRPPNCVNQILIGSPVDLGSKPTDMRFHDLRFGVEVKLPYLLKEHGARDNTTGIAQEIFEQPELPWLKVDALAAAFHLSCDQIHFQIGDAKCRLNWSERRAAPKRAQPSDQFRKREGLRQIVVTPGIQPFHPIINAAASREEQHGRLDARASQRFEQV